MLNFYLSKLRFSYAKQAMLIVAVLCIPAMTIANDTINTVSFAKRAVGVIAGKVIDEKGESIPGATIRIAGQTTGAQSSMDGSFSFNVQPGTYTVEVSYISYQTKRITEVVVKSGEVTNLTISLKPQSSDLKEVVITSTYNKASSEGLYTRQKNAASITNGISAEQIAKTPDANVGQSLKRISGISTFDNKYVIVRGISERYNVATLDGTPQPSTDFTRRNFSFDLIPSEIIEGITVVKTITPDLPVGFAGGLVQVTTRDIPTRNFISFGMGTGINDQSTGRNFLSGKRGKNDYFGFDDGTRKMAGYLKATEGHNAPGRDGGYTEGDYEFSKQFTNNWNLYKYKALPNQNYSLAFGQSLNLKTPGNRIGYIVALNYRNSQTITHVENRRDLFSVNEKLLPLFGEGPIGTGRVYNFNTTYGGIINLGYRSQKNQISLRNSYSRIFNNPLTDVFGYDNNLSDEMISPSVAPSTERIITEPDFLGLLQNKLQGEHQLSTVKLVWDVSRTNVSRQRKDMLRRQLDNSNQAFGNYFYDVVSDQATTVFPLSRQAFTLDQTDYNYSVSGSKALIKEGPFANTFKMGYVGFSKKQSNTFVTAYLRPTGAVASTTFNATKSQIEDVHDADLFGENRLVYDVNPFGINEYSGKSSFHAGYAMIDQKLWGKLRAIGGLRVEYFKLFLIGDAITSINGLFSPETNIIPQEKDIDKAYRVLPSANFTYALTDEINLRTAYSQSMVRPEFNERSLTTNFNSDLLADISGNIIVSTKVDSYDFRAEWFPGAGEVVSAGAFYKYMDRPLELVKQSAQALYAYNNSEWAKSYGIEAEVRKNLGFINEDLPLLKRFVVFSNATVLRSEVLGVYGTSLVPVDAVNRPNDYFLQNKISKQTRPLYGQTPFLVNGGLEYNGDIFGINIVHNHTGRKFYILTDDLSLNEYEAPYDQTDVQLNANIFNKKGKIRLNLGNLFNNTNFFYNGQASYENIDPNGPELGKKLKPGFSDGYEKEDFVTFKRRMGRNVTVSLNYSF
ncbi:TonB-dependent receptor [Pedobacter psychroterrae]|uniref:TonB-dependent receptor n=1 Tax=Pedobacter psychroterrae TaxID=2530453 RepID=A0A4R0N9D7_9SPHI|nr:TonB-dependent receptor [Pedobacter psychroterrae]TCC96808.1 TonB-dependent receptor [Pedobacter psychroterrae]